MSRNMIIATLLYVVLAALVIVLTVDYLGKVLVLNGWIP